MFCIHTILHLWMLNEHFTRYFKSPACSICQCQAGRGLFCFLMCSWVYLPILCLGCSVRDSVYFGSPTLAFRAVSLEMLSQSVLRGLQLLIQEGLSHICQLHAGALDILGSLKWLKMLVLRQLISTYRLYWLEWGLRCLKGEELLSRSCHTYCVDLQ